MMDEKTAKLIADLDRWLQGLKVSPTDFIKHVRILNPEQEGMTFITLQTQEGDQFTITIEKE